MLYSPLWALLGLFIVLVAVYDFYVTTVAVSGSGPISKRLSRWLWQGLLSGHRRHPNHRLLKAGGPAVLMLLILTWFGMCWLGWFLVFCGSEEAVINAANKQNASVWERAHYAGYTITTIGYGNFRAPNPLGQFASIVSGFNGLFMVTLAVTYIMPVISATVEKRKLALLINAMGSTTPEIISNGRGRGDFGPLASQTEQVSTLISALAEQHYAYPVLHYFHSTLNRNSLPLNLTRLSEVIDMVVFAFRDLPPETTTQLGITKRLINSFASDLESAFTDAAEVMPCPPDCAEIGALSHRSANDIEDHLRALPERKLLLAYIKNDGWSWQDVHPTASR